MGYKIYFIYISMYQEMRNQTNATCLQNLFSIFLPTSTQRVLSDKKIQRQKKINLSLTEDKKAKSKSCKKLAVCRSIRTKQTPSTSQHNWQVKQQSTQIRQGSGMGNRGLNFHPRKISFNQKSEKTKIKTQNVYPYGCVPSLKLDTHKPNSSVRKGQNIVQFEMHKLKDKKPPSFFNNENRSQPNPRQFNKAHIIQRNHSNTLKRIREQINNTVKQLEVMKLDSLNVSKEENLPSTYPTSQKKQEEQELCQIKIEKYSHEWIKRQSAGNSLKHVSENIIQTPKNKKILSTQLHTKNQKFEIEKKVTNLFEGALTIQSKYGDSSQREESVCYSNVIQRTNVQQLRFNNKNQIQNWNSLRKKSLNGNLFEQFDSSTYRNIQSVNNINFKKRKNVMSERFSLEHNKERELRSNKNLTLIGNLYAEDKPIEDQTLFHNIDIPYNEHHKVKGIYEQFSKINYLGVGRFASVYLCSISSLNFVFAMKQILKFTLTINNLEAQQRKQIQIQYFCNHPHIINLYHAWSDDKKYYIAMEYGQETLLNKIEKQYRLKQEDCITYIHEIAKGLEYLHQHSIIHRDIKPENIILVNGMCKIGDFGWATRSQSGVFRESCGTPCYISPQVYKLEEYTYKADCWSLGILAFQLVNGKLSQSCFSKRILDRQSLKYIHPVSEQYKILVHRLLAIEEKDRPTISEVLGMQIFKGRQ